MTTATTKNANTSPVSAIPGFKAYDQPIEVQLDREVYAVDEHGKQDIHGFMLGVKRMSPKANVRNPKEWLAVAIRLTQPIKKDGKVAIEVGKDVYVGGVKLEELYTMATDPKKAYQVILRPTSKIELSEGRSTWGFEAKLVGEAPREFFGPPIQPVSLKGAGSTALLGSGDAERDLDAIVG
jgi:hypothetical protein